MEYMNATRAFVDLGTHLLQAPEQTSRAGNTRELLFQSFSIQYPEQRCFILPHRNDNIFAKIAETIWVIAGRNDMKFLSKYLPRAVDYSDDGVVWRAGYGLRMRDFGSHMEDFDPMYQIGGTDQLAEVYNLLKKDRYTRRAVMSFWDPNLDYGDTKDTPCNCWLHFIIRENLDGQDELHLNIAQRSSDIMFGFSGINTFEFSTLQMLLAGWLNCKVGLLNYNITSLHVYEKHFKRLADITHDYNHSSSIYYFDLPIAGTDNSQYYHTLQSFDICLKTFFTLEEQLTEYSDTQLDTHDDFLNNCLDMLHVYKMWQASKPAITANLIDLLSEMPDNDFKLAALEYISRDDMAILDEVETSINIMTALTVNMPGLSDER